MLRVIFKILGFYLLTLSSVCYSFNYNSNEQLGWWWYKDYPKKKEKEEKVQEKVEQKSLKAQVEAKDLPQEKFPSVNNETKQVIKKFKPLETYTYEELLHMPVSEFRELYNYYLELAVSNPTEENVFYLLNLQDVLAKKAAYFTSTMMHVAQKYADYFGGGFYPTTIPGIVAVTRAQAEEIERYVKRNKDNFGIILFEKKTCPYCQAQKEIMKHVLADGIQVKFVDVDKYPWFAREYEVEIVPSMLLVYVDGRTLPIGSGVMSKSEIYQRIRNVLRILKGESPENIALFEFQKGTPLDPKVPPPLWRDKNKSR